MPKRARTEMSTSDLDRRRRIARAINAKISNKFPLSEYGRAYYKRGTDANIAMWGPTYKEASADQKALRKSMGYVGRGIYDGQGVYEGQGAYSVGRNWRKFAQSKIGRAASSAIASGITRSALAYSGGGLYTENQLMRGGARSFGVSGAGDETDTITVSMTEFVKDIYAPAVASGSSGFASQSIAVNPGLTGFAPSLSQLACNYTDYTLLQLVYELRPVISESNVNNGITGLAMMVFNYNPNDPNPDSKEDVMSTHGSVSGRIVDGIRMGVECDPSKSRRSKYFVRTTPVAIGRDADEYDHGHLVICTNNIPAVFSNLQLFELWVSYTVKLHKRKPGALKLLNQLRDMWINTANVSVSTWAYDSFEQTGSNGVLIAQQSNLGCRLKQYPNDALSALKPNGYTPAQEAARVGKGFAAKQCIILTFPPDFNGYVKISFSQDLHGHTYDNTTVDNRPFAVVVSGNVTGVDDMWGAYEGSTNTDSPSHEVGSYNTLMQVYEGHFKVKSVTGGVDNEMLFGTFIRGTSGTSANWMLCVTEYFPFGEPGKSNRPDFLILKSGDVANIV